MVPISGYVGIVGNNIADSIAKQEPSNRIITLINHFTRSDFLIDIDRCRNVSAEHRYIASQSKEASYASKSIPSKSIRWSELIRSLSHFFKFPWLTPQIVFSVIYKWNLQISFLLLTLSKNIIFLIKPCLFVSSVLSKNMTPIFQILKKFAYFLSLLLDMLANNTRTM